MDVNQLAGLIALTLGVGWASGINLYAAVLALGLAGATGYADLPERLEIIQDPIVIMAAGIMYFAQFTADKVPGVDTGWDAIHTFIRLPAGALLASGMMGDQSAALQLAAGLVGGSLAAASHATKSGTRVLINTSPEPFSNWTASVVEDVAVFLGIWLMLNHPWLYLVLLVVFILVLVWLLPRLWRAIRFLFQKLAAFFGGEKPEPLSPDDARVIHLPHKPDPL